VLIVVLVVAWVLLLREFHSAALLDYNYASGPMSVLEELFGRPGTLVGVPAAPFFILVGYKNCVRTKEAAAVLDRLQNVNIARYSAWSATGEEEYAAWFRSREDSGQIPLGFRKEGQDPISPVVFRRDPAIEEDRQFIGGLDELFEFLIEQFPEEGLEKDLQAWKAREAPAAPTSSTFEHENENENLVETLDLPAEQADEDDEAADFGNEKDEFIHGKATPWKPTQEERERAQAYLESSDLNKLPKQVRLRAKNFATTYRRTEKRVTNYRPVIDSLRELGWSYMQMAPLLSTWILVQDQTTASFVLKRYQRAIINNIGYQGQSCFGGTKGYQLRCRSEFAEKYGCKYDDIGVQPPQYRLWMKEECRRYFDEICPNGGDDRLWIEKPSGGQHGAGMKVRNGCSELRKIHGSCSSIGKKYISMPYLSPALIDGHKFDVRSFLLIASLDPLLVFYHDGFARKAANKYNSDTSDVNAHITNAVSQTSEDHFYEFSRLQDALHRGSGFPPDFMEDNFREHAIKVQKFVFHASRQFMTFRKKGVYQIFALDWIIDDDGGIHMLEANSNPLVTVYREMAEEFTETWASMVDLVLKIHTEPGAIFSEQNPELRTGNPKERFVFRNWHLIFNELEERRDGTSFNPCDLKISQFSLGKKESPHVRPSAHEGHGAQDENVNDGLVVEPEQEQSSTLHHEVSMDDPRIPYKVSAGEIKEAITNATRRPCETIDFIKDFEGCVQIDRNNGPDDFVTRCPFVQDGFFYVIEPFLKEGATRSNCYPIVLVAAGVHPNERAGIVAARFIRKNWTLKKARLVVFERLNPKGVGKGRYIPKVDEKERDLNRNFPKSGLVGALAHSIWAAVSRIKPHVFIDLHEGWGFYNRLKENKGGPLVGNPRFSKGSTVISTEIASPVAKFVINRVNDLTVDDATKRFLNIVPPIDTGLASMIDRSMKSLVMVVETTSKSQALLLRGKQQLIVVGTTFMLLGLVPVEFEPTQGFTEAEACIAGTPNCGLPHPDDVVVSVNQSEEEAAPSVDYAESFTSEESDDVFEWVDQEENDESENSDDPEPEPEAYNNDNPDDEQNEMNQNNDDTEEFDLDISDT